GPLSVTVPASLFEPVRGDSATRLLYRTARGPGRAPVGYRRSLGRLSRLSLAGPAGHFLHVLHVLAGCLSTLERRRRPPDQPPRLFHRFVHAMGGVRLRARHAPPASPLPGDPSLSAPPSARPPQPGPSRLSGPCSLNARVSP